ncbi:hypothetical protein [Francisella persica]|uniref:hypothetical protein n=1 Tax=Francisella persica TaxID=954 RepID=UPI000A9CD6A0|nr:hypothetical protein [Francisella persica]
MFYPYFANILANDEFKQIINLLGIGYLAKFINTMHDWGNIYTIFWQTAKAAIM